MSTSSIQDWQGLQSSKFGSTRRHLRPQDQLSGYEGVAISVLGRKHYDQEYSKVGEYKPQVKVFPELSNQTADLNVHASLGGVQKLVFVPAQRKARAEKLQMYSKNSQQQQEDLQKNSIKSYTIAKKPTSIQYALEQQLLQKTRTEGLPKLPNRINVQSIGDKSSKNPENSTDFYSPGGLILKQVNEKQVLSARVQSKLSWKEREKLEEAREDKRQVEELDAWEDYTLRGVNPNWKNPEKFSTANHDLSKGDPKKGVTAPLKNK